MRREELDEHDGSALVPVAARQGGSGIAERRRHILDLNDRNGDVPAVLIEDLDQVALHQSRVGGT